MKRREFLGLVAGGIAWPAVARAQQQTMPLIGFLSSRSPEDFDATSGGVSPRP